MLRPPKPPKNSDVRVRMYWGDVLYDTALIDKRDTAHVGAGEGNRFVVDVARRFPKGDWPVARRNRDGSCIVCFHEEQPGHFAKTDGAVPLRELALSKDADRDSTGVCQIPLASGDSARLTLEDVTFYVDWVGRDAPLAKLTWPKPSEALVVAFALTLTLLSLWGVNLAATRYGQIPVPEPKYLVTLLPPPEPVVPIEQVVEPPPKEEVTPPKEAAVKETNQNAKPAPKPRARKAAPPPKPQIAKEEPKVDLGALMKDLTGVETKRAAAPSRAPRPSAGRVSGAFATGELGSSAVAEKQTTTEGQGEGRYTADADVDLKSPSQVQGGLSRMAVDSVVRRQEPRIRRCYQTALNHSPGLAGSLDVVFQILPTGKVTGVKVAKTDLKSTSAIRCVLDEIKSLQFPEPEAGKSVSVEYPFSFSSN